MKNILVTGAAGFIGSHICLLLLEEGFDVFALDSFVNSSPRSLEKVLDILKNLNVNAIERLHLIEGDITKEDEITAIFDKGLQLKKPIENVIHLAGLKSVYESTLDPLGYWESNVIGSIKLLKIMKKYNCKKIVFSSSATVYKNSDLKMNEDQLLEPVNPYGNSKLAIEKILNDLFFSDPSYWRIACLRYFNPIGAHPSGLIGEDPLSKVNNIYPTITKVAIGEIDKISIFGSDWPTKDGTGIRDYIHIMDLAEGHLKALSYLNKCKNKVLNLNLGTGKGTSVLELINVFQKVNNIEIPFKFAPRRKGDYAISVADNSLAKKILDWEPKRNLEDMCRDGWNWQLKNPRGFDL